MFLFRERQAFVKVAGMRETNIVQEAFEYKGISVRAFADELGIKGHGKVDEMRKGKKAIPPWVAGKCAEILGRDWAEAVAETMAEQARSEAEQRFWRGRLIGVSRSAAALVLAGVIGVTAPSMEAQASGNVPESTALYILRAL